MVQEAFWHRFVDTSVPVGQSSVVIPTLRNIAISGFGYGSDSALMVARLEILMLDGKVKQIMPTPWNDSASPQGIHEGWIPRRAFADYEINMREMPLDPVPKCDVAAIQIRLYNQDVVTHAIEGHVRGSRWG